MVWDVQCNNMNQLVELTGLDNTIDKSTWVNASFIADVRGMFKGKKVSKGGQHTLLLDAHSQYIYTYMSNNKSWKQTAPFTAKGPVEINHLVDEVAPLVKGASQDEGDK